MSNMPNSCKTKPTANFMPHFSTNKRLYTASDCSHAHWIWLHSTTHSEVSRPPLLWIGNCAWIRLKSRVAAATTQITKLAQVTYLGALSRIKVILIPQISAHPPILAQRKVHCLWALFREGTVILLFYSASVGVTRTSILAMQISTTYMYMHMYTRIMIHLSTTKVSVN